MIEGTPIPLYTRIRQRLEPVFATATTGVVLAGSLVGCGGGLRNNETLCGGENTRAAATQTVELPKIGDQLKCIFPEIGGRQYQAIEIAPNATLVNFTDQPINEAALKQTYAFLESVHIRDTSLFTDVENGDVVLTIKDEKVGVHSFTDTATQRIFIYVPDNINPETFKKAFNDPGSVGSRLVSFTQRSAALYPGITTNVSFIFAQPGDPKLDAMNTELCQSLNVGYAKRSEANKPTDRGQRALEQARLDTIVQESLCNSVAAALTAVQNGVSEEEFRQTYTHSGMPLLDGFPYMGIRPEIYAEMRKIQPVVAPKR